VLPQLSLKKSIAMHVTKKLVGVMLQVLKFVQGVTLGPQNLKNSDHYWCTMRHFCSEISLKEKEINQLLSLKKEVVND